MSNAVPFLLQGKNIILVIDGKSHTVSKDTHISYAKIVEALKAKQWDDLRNLVSPAKAIIDFGAGNVSIVDNKVYWKGQPFPNALSTRMIEMYQDGFPIDPMVRFMENLMQNPSKRSVDQVYGFLEKNKLPITEDGHFLAYKKVNHDYMDIHSGKFSNHIGATLSMDRNLVDDNPDSHCSTGLHFCSESYLNSFGSSSQPVMVLKINPADVVSIPTDYNGAKGRCAKYTVVAQVNGDPKLAFASVVDNVHAPVEKAAPAPKVAPASIPPEAAWPFPDAPPYTAPTKAVAAKKAVAQRYDVIRKNNGHLYSATARNVSLSDAQLFVAAAVRQKKAQLIIVKAGTNDEV